MADPTEVHHTAELISWRMVLEERKKSKEGDTGCPKPEKS